MPDHRAVDVDDDGDADVLVASYADDSVRFFKNDGPNWFGVYEWQERVVTTLADSAYGVAAYDVDGDGDDDLLAASTADDSVRWYENDGQESFSARLITAAADGASAVAAADVDNDGDGDVVSAWEKDDVVAWHENDGSESFATRYVSTAAARPFALEIRDVDGDADADVLAAN